MVARPYIMQERLHARSVVQKICQKTGILSELSWGAFRRPMESRYWAQQERLQINSTEKKPSIGYAPTGEARFPFIARTGSSLFTYIYENDTFWTSLKRDFLEIIKRDFLKIRDLRRWSRKSAFWTSKSSFSCLFFTWFNQWINQWIK